MTGAPKRPTAADVARLSGVSTATVSYILNDRSDQTISNATRARVLAAAAELDYRVNAPAQALARGRSQLVVIDLSELPGGALVDSAAYELADAFERRGYVPVLDRRAVARTDHALLIALCRAVAPSAVVSFNALPTSVETEVRAAGVETIAYLGPDLTTLQAWTSDAAKAQVRYLAENGHRHIAYAPTPSPALVEIDGVRRTALAAEVARLGLRVTELPASLDPRQLAATLLELRASADPPTAIAAYNDDVGIALLNGALFAGLSVPHDIAVIGIDDIALAETVFPGLSSIRFTTHEQRTVEQSVDLIVNGTGGGLFTGNAGIEVVVRASA